MLFESIVDCYWQGVLKGSAAILLKAIDFIVTDSFPWVQFLETLLKACVCYFHQIFIFFTKLYPFKNFKKCFLFHLKSSFHSRDIQFFVFLSFPLFVPVSHCFRGWLKINLKVHDVIDCLNKNSITHFVWYLGKEKRYDNETLSIDEVSDNEQFYRKIRSKMYSPR